MARMIDIGMKMKLMPINITFIVEGVNGDIWQWIWYAHILKISVDSLVAY